MAERSGEGICRLCGAPHPGAVFVGVPAVGSRLPSRFRVERCESCGFRQTSPLPSAEELQQIYEAGSYTWQAPAGLLGRLEVLYRQSLVRLDQVRVLAWACERAGGREVLDVGCADGLLVAEARRAGMLACGVDYPGTPRWPGCDPSWKEAANLETFDQPPGRWDVVSFFHVVEHLRDPVAMLGRVRQWLRPGGMLVVQVPNAVSYQARAFGTHWYGLDVPRHLSHFAPETLERLLVRSGFTPERLRHLSWRDNGPLIASSLLIGMDPRIERERSAHAPSRGPLAALARRLLYFGATWGSTPLVLLEAALASGGTITAFARR